MIDFLRHGDPRTEKPSTDRERMNGAVCSTLVWCSEPDIIITSSVDGDYRHYQGRCQCGATFYASETIVER